MTKIINLPGTGHRIRVSWMKISMYAGNTDDLRGISL